MFEAIARGDRRELWRDWGARDMAHWLSMRYGISHWKALRWIAAAYALEVLPAIAAAFASGRLSVDKVVELTRCATPETEDRLLAWAQGVSCAAIRRKGDLAVSSSIREAGDGERARFLSWWWSDDGRRLGLAAELPAASGAVVARAIQRVSERVPVMPGGTMPPTPTLAGPMPWWCCALPAWGLIPIRIGPRWWCMPPWHPWSRAVGGRGSRTVG